MLRKIFILLSLFMFMKTYTITQPLQNRLLIATSPDGITFTKLYKVLYDSADVPDAITTETGKVYVYFQGILGTASDKIIVGVSSDGINNWSFTPIKISGIENWLVRPCDPDVIYKDKIFRLYFTGDPKNDKIPETYSAISTDGINFTLESGVRYEATNLSALDPSLLWIGDTLHYFAGGGTPSQNWRAVSIDGLQFSKIENLSIGYLMMANGIKVGNAYKFYCFSNMPPINIQSVSSQDGRKWTLDQGIRLELNKMNKLENLYVKDPAVIFRDGTYIMYYVTRKSEYTKINSSDIYDNDFILSQNYPNPFNPSTKIEYTIPDNTFVIVKVYDTNGKEIETLISKMQSAGIYSVNWYPKNLTSGVYLYTIQAGKYSETKKMLYVR